MKTRKEEADERLRETDLTAEGKRQGTRGRQDNVAKPEATEPTESGG